MDTIKGFKVKVIEFKKALDKGLRIISLRDRQKEKHIELLQMLFELLQVYRKDGPQTVERHIENPHNSLLFKKYPKLISNQRLMETIHDSLTISLMTDFDADFLEKHLHDKTSDDLHIKMVQKALVVFQVGCPPFVCIEASRNLIPYDERPTFQEMDISTTTIKRVTHSPEQNPPILSQEIEEVLDENAKLRFANKKEGEEFDFNDLSSIQSNGMKCILREVTNDKLLLAFKLAPASFKLRVYSALSTKAVEMLKEDFANMGYARVSDVEAAQDHILKVALRLEAEGKILIPRGGSYDNMVK